MRPRLALLIAVLAVGVSAQTAPLTLDDCIARALAAPSFVTLAKQDLEIARLGITAARAGFLPQTQINNGFTYNSPSGNPDAGRFIALNGVREYSHMASSAIELDTSGRLRAAYARAKADQQISAAYVQLSQRDLKRLVTIAYYRLLLARHLVTANSDMLARATSFEALTRKLLSGGEVAQADVVKASSQVAFLGQALNAARLDAAVTNQDLASFWTTDVATDVGITDTLTQPAPPETAAQPQPYLKRIEFNLLDAQREGFKADERRFRAERYPQLTFNYQYGIDSNRLTWRDRGSAAFVTFNIPVFDFFRNRSLAQQFRVRADQVGTNREISSRTFSRDYQTALARATLIYEQISLARQQVDTSEENLRLSSIRYEGGEGPALDVVAAQTQLTQAQSNYFTALFNYANARADLEVAAGR
ncbi:MAG: TolC family protein [Bryobacteraceae bacterium]